MRNLIFVSTIFSLIASSIGCEAPAPSLLQDPDHGDTSDGISDSTPDIPTGEGSDALVDTLRDLATDDGDSPPPPWTNTGCLEPGVVPTSVYSLDVTADISAWQDGRFQITQTIVVTSDTAGSAITLFGTSLLLESASTGVAYDGLRATFCTDAFVPGDQVSVTISFTVDNAHQAFPSESLAGMRTWGNLSELVVAPLSSPFFANTWMFVPQAMPWIDATHDSNVVVDQINLTVITPEPSWHVVGPGVPAKSSDTHWTFTINQVMPLYALSFAASRDWVSFNAGSSSDGVTVDASVMPGKQSQAVANLATGPLALDWMATHFGPYSWGGALGFAEVPGFPGGFEHVGAVWLGPSVIDGGIVGDYVVAHEVAHHWFGNDLAFEDWGDVWLSEGFVDWLTVYKMLPDIASGPESAELLSNYRRDAAALSYPAIGAPQPGPLSMPEDADVAIQYASNLRYFYAYGAAVLHMIEVRLTDRNENLLAMLQQWFETHRQSRVTTEDFEGFLAAATGDSLFWEAFFVEWVHTAPCPTLSAGDYSFDGATVSFELARSLVGGLQALDELNITATAGSMVVGTTTISLPKAGALVSVSVPVTAAPQRLVVDGIGRYVFRLGTEGSWSGPEVSFLP